MLSGDIVSAGSLHRLKGRAGVVLVENSIATEVSVALQLPDLEMVEHGKRFKDVCLYSLFLLCSLGLCF